MTTTHNKPEPVLFLEWDTFAITQHQAAYLVETGDAADEDEGFNLACMDSDLFQFEWDCLLDNLTEQLNTMNPNGFWSGEVTNFGWNKRQGFTEFQADNGRDFLANILPKTDCTFRIYIEDERVLKIQNFHHDSPTGNEWYTLTPLTEELCAAA